MESSENAPANINGITYKKLLAFFLPLAVTPFFITSIHSLMNAAVARLPYPELSLAVFTVVKGVSNAVKAPDRMFMQMTTSLVDDRKSFYTASKFIWVTCAFFFGALFLLGYTPAGIWFLRNLIGLTDPEAIRFAILGLRITCFLPVVETLRNVHRGLVIRHERTKIVTVGTAVRLLSITAFLFWAVRSQVFPGVVVASLAWTAGIGIEGLVVLFAVFYYFSSPARAAEMVPDKSGEILTFAKILSFFIPLAAMRFLRSFLQPLIQSSIARSQADPTQALAAFGVAFGIMMLMVGPLRNLHQCSLVYVGRGEGHNWKKVKRFSIMAGVILTLISFIISLSPLGYWILRNLIGVSEEVAGLGRLVMLSFSFLPLIRAIRETYWGLLMRRQTTRLIGYGKALNLTTVFIVLVIMILGMDLTDSVSPAILGALAFSIGQAVETFVVWYVSQRNINEVIAS
ncbi:MAG: hypothetical protein ACQEQG_08185 [Bacillota bacterium]